MSKLPVPGKFRLLNFTEMSQQLQHFFAQCLKTNLQKTYDEETRRYSYSPFRNRNLKDRN